MSPMKENRLLSLYLLNMQFVWSLYALNLFVQNLAIAYHCGKTYEQYLSFHRRFSQSLIDMGEASHPESSTNVFPGDEVISSPSMLYNQTVTIDASAGSVFPWVRQLGKGRGGWYCPAWLERLVPPSWRATRRIETQWQTLAVGDRVPDYGFSVEDFFIVEEIQEPNALVYRSERYGCLFSWAILLREDVRPGGGNTVETVVHLRFRGQISSQGWKRKVIVWGGGKLDHWTTKPMLLGLKERAERSHHD